MLLASDDKAVVGISLGIVMSKYQLVNDGQVANNSSFSVRDRASVVWIPLWCAVPTLCCVCAVTGAKYLCMTVKMVVILSFGFSSVRNSSRLIHLQRGNSNLRGFAFKIIVT